MKIVRMKIASVHGYQVYDSRGTPTVEAEVVLDTGVRGRGIVPSGASTGQFEVLELRDRDPQRFGGKSVFKAIAHIDDQIAPAVIVSRQLPRAFARCPRRPGAGR